MPPKGAAQWTLRKTDDRIALMEELREEVERVKAGQGERIHGQLTDAQIIDWALEEFKHVLNAHRRWSHKVPRSTFFRKPSED